MHRGLRILFLLLLIVTVGIGINTCSFTIGYAIAKTDTESLTILYSSDAQGRISPCEECPKEKALGGLEKRAAYVKSIRDVTANILLVEIGDVFGEASAQSKINAQIVLGAMEEMRYDAMTLGEKEFVFGRTYLEEKMKNINFPVISANIVDATNGELFTPSPYIIKQMPSGLRVGIIGLLSDEFALPLPANEKGLNILPPLKTLQKYLSELKEGADLIIVLSHLGVFDSGRLARAVDGVDIIVSGHGGQGIEKPIEINGTLIVQTRDKGEYIGRLELTFGENKRIVSYANSLIPLA